MTDSTEKVSAQKKPKPAFKVAHGLVKTLAILIGLPLTVLALMSLIGLATDNFWIRLVPAVIVALGAPLFLVDRLLPDDDATTARGLPTDVLALLWLGFAVLFVGLAQPVTGSLLVAEADRFAPGTPLLAQVTYWMAGTTPVTSATRGDDVQSGDAGAEAGVELDGGPVTGSTDAGPSSSADADEADSGGSANTEGDEGDASTERPSFTPAQLFQKMSPAVVTISVQGKGRFEKGSGTGFFIDDQGTIATNQHVIEKAVSVGVKLIGEEYPGGHRWLHEVELLAEDSKVDLALLRVTAQPDIEPLKLGDSNALTVGEQVICIGNPLGLEHTLSDGIVSARRVHQGRRWVQMTAPISPGNSGGPVITSDGLVIGVATASIRMVNAAQNLNLAVPINVLKAMIRDDYPDRRQFGSGPGGPSTW